MYLCLVQILMDLLAIFGVTRGHYVRRDGRQFNVDSSGAGSITNVYITDTQMMTQGSAFHSQSQSVKSDKMMAAMMMLIMHDQDRSSGKMPLLLAMMAAEDSDTMMMIQIMMLLHPPKTTTTTTDTTTTTLSSDIRTTSAVSILTSTVPSHICRMCGEEKGSSISKVRMIIV